MVEIEGCICLREYHLGMSFLNDALYKFAKYEDEKDDEFIPFIRETLLRALWQIEDIEKECGIKLTETKKYLDEAIDALDKRDTITAKELATLAKDKLFGCK